jgi:hypothetical protein
MGIFTFINLGKKSKIANDSIRKRMERNTVDKKGESKVDLTERQQKILIGIHNAIHNPNINHVILSGTKLDIKVGKNGCRYASVPSNGRNVTMMAQNPNKVDKSQQLSKGAMLARQGYKITWFMKQPSWICVTTDLNGKTTIS